MQVLASCSGEASPLVQRQPEPWQPQKTHPLRGQEPADMCTMGMCMKKQNNAVCPQPKLTGSGSSGAAGIHCKKLPPSQHADSCCLMEDGSPHCAEDCAVQQ